MLKVLSLYRPLENVELGARKERNREYGAGSPETESMELGARTSEGLYKLRSHLPFDIAQSVGTNLGAGNLNFSAGNSERWVGLG